MKYFLLFLILLQSASALSIAASPNKILLDGGATLRLFNPNDVMVDYSIVSEAFSKNGVMEKNSFEIFNIDNDEWYGKDVLQVYYSAADGSEGIALRSGLQIPIERYRPVVPMSYNLAVFIGVFIITLILVLTLYKLL